MKVVKTPMTFLGGELSDVFFDKENYQNSFAVNNCEKDYKNNNLTFSSKFRPSSHLYLVNG